MAPERDNIEQIQKKRSKNFREICERGPEIVLFGGVLPFLALFLPQFKNGKHWAGDHSVPQRRNSGQRRSGNAERVRKMPIAKELGIARRDQALFRNLSDDVDGHALSKFERQFSLAFGGQQPAEHTPNASR